MPFEDLTGWKRQVWRWLLLFIMVTQLFCLTYQWSTSGKVGEVSAQLRQHYADADAYHQKREDIGAARARVSVMIVNAIANGRTFTAEEKIEISELWHKAEFDKIQEKFLDGEN